MDHESEINIYTIQLFYVCVGFVCVQIKLFHSHSHTKLVI